MPTNYALRTPIYASAYSTTSGIQSAKLLLNITGVGTPVYTIVKNAASSVRVVFEIAELLRDYLDVTFDGTTYGKTYIAFTSTIQFFDAVNAGGSAVGSAIATTSGDGWEAYGLFTDGVNPVLPFENRTFNTQAKQTHTLSSGYYPEYANAYFEELLLSEYVWYTRPEDNQPNSDETIPVIVKTSSMIYKTSLNDRLIEYTIEFEDTFDYINNIR